MPNAGLLLTTLLTVAAPPAPETAASAHLFSPITSASAEKLPLLKGHATAISVQPLIGRIEVTGEPTPAFGPSRLCPHATVEYGALVLHCIASRFAATLDPNGRMLTVVGLRGLPWRTNPDAPPRFGYDPRDPERPLVCPPSEKLSQDRPPPPVAPVAGAPSGSGSGPAAPVTRESATALEPATAAECAYLAGDLSHARQLYEAIATAATGSAADAVIKLFANLRLGDISLAEDDPDGAVPHYQQVAAARGPTTALAKLRLCEVADQCLESLMAPIVYPLVFRPEAKLRIARWYAFNNRWADLLRMLSVELPAGTSAREDAGACRRDERLCQRLLLAALSAVDEDVETQALELYLEVPHRLEGPNAEQLGRAAAEVAVKLGVPRFAGNVMASVFPNVPAPRRADHLERTLELYLAADDGAHAEAIADFARSRLDKKVLAETRWKKLFAEVTREVSRQVPHHAGPQHPETRGKQPTVLGSEAQLDRDVANALKLAGAKEANK